MGQTKKKRRVRRRGGYEETLRNPRWQKKRLGVLERAGWRCEWCGGRDEELQVHHGYYGKTAEGERRKPWEYPDESLYCLCDSCHEKAESARAGVYFQLAKIHPRFHWDVRRLLLEVQELLASDPGALPRKQVVLPEPEG